MEILKQAIYDKYALWIGDNVNKKLNIPTKYEIALKIYEVLSDETKYKVGEVKRITEISQIFLDSATGTMSSLMNLLESELKYEGEGYPYSYLSKIDHIDTIITHSHSNIVERIWEEGDVHNIFEPKPSTESTKNLFKVLGDYRHPEKIVLTSQNMRKVKMLKLYDEFWNNLDSKLRDKNLILLGVNLDEDTKEVLKLAFSKLKSLPKSRYFVTATPLSLEDEEWVLSNGFEFIYEKDEEFINKIHLYLNGYEIENISKEEKIKEKLEEEQVEPSKEELNEEQE
ncbi:MAG: hypothetical protein DSY38_02855, partial [Fusobacteria bacterium]